MFETFKVIIASQHSAIKYNNKNITVRDVRNGEVIDSSFFDGARSDVVAHLFDVGMFGNINFDNADMRFSMVNTRSPMEMAESSGFVETPDGAEEIRARGVQFQGSQFLDPFFSEGDFQSSNFDGISCVGYALFSECNMRDTKFVNITLKKSAGNGKSLVFLGCDMAGAVFSVDMKWERVAFPDCKNLDKAVIVDKEGKVVEGARVCEEGLIMDIGNKKAVPLPKM